MLAFERAKTVHAFDHAITVIGLYVNPFSKCQSSKSDWAITKCKVVPVLNKLSITP
jgi:hypothetical protein